MPADDNLIEGVPRHVIEAFLRLIKKAYPKVDEASFFVEQQAQISSINIGITNQRDALSHLATILNHPGMGEHALFAQVASAEEHLRRATLESYERAANKMVAKCLPLYEDYKKHVLPLQAAYDDLQPAPPADSIDAWLRRINDQRYLGRKAKALNAWTPEWEEGTKALVAAFIDARDLVTLLERYVIIGKRHRNQRNALIVGAACAAIAAAGAATVILLTIHG
jgi:hypothetical protein